MEVSILVVNYNSWDVLLGAIESIHENPPREENGDALPYEIIVVDNASPRRPERSVARVREALRADVDRLVSAPENGGYAAGMNLACSHASGRYLMVSNPDVLYREDCLSLLRRHLETHRDVGVAMPVTFADLGHECRLPAGIAPSLADLVRESWALYDTRAAERLTRTRTTRYLPIWRPQGDVDLEVFGGWGFLIRRGLIEKIGFFDERYPLYYEDSDLSMRVRAAGSRIVQVAGARMVHLYNRSAGTEPDAARRWRDESEWLYFRRWRGRWGALVVDAVRAFHRSRFARARVAPLLGFRPAGVENRRPVIELGCDLSDFLVEVAYEPRFLLAAAAFGSGSRWAPGPEFVEALAGRAYFRIVDLGDSRLTEVGRWTFDPVSGAA